MEEKRNNPCVSIIVPIYKVNDGLLRKCIESLLAQTFKDIEILLVDDATSESNRAVMEEYAKVSEKVRIVTHPQNKGLFQARITGVKSAGGKYIAFCDADDYVTIDWIRLLVKKAEEDRADIVMANTISEDESGYRYVYTATANYNKHRAPLHKEEILDELMVDEGQFFSLHTMWNKLYSRKLWEQALPTLEKFSVHLIMTEDILFSIVLFYFAKKMSFSDHDGYFYYRNAQSSTIGTQGVAKCKKNVDDLAHVFGCVEKFFKERNKLARYRDSFEALKIRYFHWWCGSVSENTKDQDDEEQRAIREKFFRCFGREEFEFPNEEDGFLTVQTAPWEGKLEEMKRAIVAEDVQVVSFDIFDTLILRPFLEASDIHEVLKYTNPIADNYDFSVYRALAERRCRSKMGATRPNFEDVTLDEIYDEMAQFTGCQPEEIARLKQAEIKMELDIARPRMLGKELLELALHAGKKVILVSDMYLTADTVEAMLAKCGISGYERLYLSSRERALKATGKLFLRVREDYPEEKYNILHIGDNWNSDYLTPPKYGMRSRFLPKTTDLLLNRLGDKFSGNSVGNAVKNGNAVIDLTQHLKKLPVRCLYGVAANLMFDNPFASFRENAHYNADPYYMGGLAVGMYLFGVAQWMGRAMTEKGVGKIHFTARDGYYIKNIYDKLRQAWMPEAPESTYLWVSRKALIPEDIRCGNDVLSIRNRTEWRAQSPSSLYKTYRAVFCDFESQGRQRIWDAGFAPDRRFASEEEFIAFLEFAAKSLYDEKQAARSREECESYLRERIRRGDAIFDLGYSGKLQWSMIRGIGFPVPGYYVHDNGFEAKLRKKQCGFEINTFYDFSPVMSGAVNEYILSDFRPTCVGYVRGANGSVEPEFLDAPVRYVDRFVVGEIQRGALDYVERLLDDLSAVQELLEFHSIDTGLQYERLLCTDCQFDRELFRCCGVEDEYWGGITMGRLQDVWEWQLRDRGVNVRETVERVVEVPVERVVEVPVERVVEVPVDRIVEVPAQIPTELLSWQLYHQKGMANKSKLQKMLYWLVIDRKKLKERVSDKTSGRD